MIRNKDHSGVSGTGMVAEGVEFSDGHAILSWVGKHSSLGVYPDINELISIHGHGESTQLMWLD